MCWCAWLRLAVPSKGDEHANEPCVSILQDRLMLEVAIIDSSGKDMYPRDHIKTGDALWPVELGDAVDAQDFEGNWYSGIRVKSSQPKPNKIKVRACPTLLSLCPGAWTST